MATLAEKNDAVAVVEQPPSSKDSSEHHGADDKALVAEGRKVDDALAFALDHDDVTWTDTEERRVRWKIDLCVLPLLFLAAILGQGDSQAYGFAAIFGLVKDLNLYVLSFTNGHINLDLHKYSLTAGIPNLGSVAAQFPLLFAAQFLSYGKFAGIIVIYAGLTALLTIVCHDFAEVMALRFFAGFATVVDPLAIIITAMWWKTNEQPLRMGIFISGSALGNLVGQGIDFGAITLKGEYAKSPWKWIYVILGSVTMAYGIVVFIMLPATPMKAWFLNPREKTIAVRRLVKNNTGIQSRSFKMKQLVEAFMDPQLYLLGIFAWSFSFVNNALGSFGSFLITSFGYTPKQSLLLSMPASAIALACMISSGILGSFFPKRRILIAMSFILPSIAGNAILWKSPRDNLHALLGGLYISTTFYGALVQSFSLLAANIGGHTKKSVVNASILVLASLGGFSGPFAYKGSEAAKGYPTGQISAMCLLAISEASFGTLWFWYYTRNKKKAPLRQERPDLAEDPKLAFSDMTDRENPVFQYVH